MLERLHLIPWLPEVATNIAGAYLRKKSGVMVGQTALSVAAEGVVSARVNRWLRHGFGTYPTLPKDVANAYLITRTTSRTEQT